MHRYLRLIDNDSDRGGHRGIPVALLSCFKLICSRKEKLLFASTRMNYFKPHYDDVRWPIKEEGTPGMRFPQLGAMHAVAAHFTRFNNPAIVTMPTGSGKTAVISAVPFLLRAERVLVLTPSRMVREQITEEFKGLLDLRRLGVLSLDIPAPAVYSVTSKIDSIHEWSNLRPYDVVVGTPNSISPELPGIARPPLDFFDVVLVDEAHHAAARSWKALLEELFAARQVLFTATPFRRDSRELIGRLVYVYELRDAYHDGVFGQLAYEPVFPQGGDADLAIATAAAARLRADHRAGMAHLIMVRTATRARALQLAELYSQHTDLKLQLVTGNHSLKRLRTTIEQLKRRELDGIICVDMLGEGFNLPNLKVAALHAPHRSLAVTLQFIGRFARTNAPDLGSAVFFALESDMELERQRLYDQGAAWEEIIPNLSSARVLQEEQTREVLGTFQAAEETHDESLDLSLYSLRPYHHVKVLHSPERIDIAQKMQPPPGFGIVHRHVSVEESTAVYVLRRRVKPEWTSVDHLDTVSHELLLLYFHESTGLLFVCSSLRTDGLYDHVAEQFGRVATLRGLSFKKVNRVLLDLADLRLFNVGMRNVAATRGSESYRTMAGPSVDEAIELSYRREFRRGHWFGSALDNGQAVTIGLSTASKVWSNTSSQIPKLVAWCKRLAEKMASERTPHTNSGLDHLATGDEITGIPGNVAYIDWNESTYNSPCSVVYEREDGTAAECQLLDMDLRVDREQIGEETIGVKLVGDGILSHLTFSLENNPVFFEGDGTERIVVQGADVPADITDYLNRHLPTFYTADCGSFEGCNYFDPPNTNVASFDALRIAVLDWSAEGVDIQCEVGDAAPRQRSIHTYLRDHLLRSDAQIVLYDHGTGELADFITLTTRADDILVTLFHCKGSSAPQPGERVDDLYELCGQAIKSGKWISRRLMAEGLKRRSARGSAFLRGTLEEFLLFLDGDLPLSLQITLVQPGLSRASVGPQSGSLLASVDDFVHWGRCARIKVIASG
jgi:superfamily II DNA or RNA helicase